MKRERDEKTCTTICIWKSALWTNSKVVNHFMATKRLISLFRGKGEDCEIECGSNSAKRDRAFCLMKSGKSDFEKLRSRTECAFGGLGITPTSNKLTAFAQSRRRWVSACGLPHASLASSSYIMTAYPGQYSAFNFFKKRILSVEQCEGAWIWWERTKRSDSDAGKKHLSRHQTMVTAEDYTTAEAALSQYSISPIHNFAFSYCYTFMHRYVQRECVHVAQFTLQKTVISTHWQILD